jgi:hypothetical protein
MPTPIERLKALWRAWKRVARVVGNFQTRVILTVIYSTVLLPFALFVRLSSDPLRIKHRPTTWIPRPEETHDLAWAHKQ